MNTLILALLCCLAEAQFHAQDTYQVGDGFDVVLGGVPSAISFTGADLPACSPSTTTTACINTANVTFDHGYTTTANSYASRQSLFESTTYAEGGGWGVSLSASASYMKTSQMSTESVDFMCGACVHSHVVSINNPSLLKLTDTAASLLKEDPDSFLEFHGPHFIKSITFGASYIASYHLAAIEQASATDLSVFAKIDAKKAFFDASVSEMLDKQASDASGKLDRKQDSLQQGGKIVGYGNGTAFSMGQAFNEWHDSISTSNTVPIYMEYLNWYELDAVQAIVDTMSIENRTKFKVMPLTESTVRSITTEMSQLSLLQSSVAEAIDWACSIPTNASQWRTSIRAISTGVEAKLDTLEAMSETDIMDIQTKIKNADTSWQAFATMYDEFVDLVSWYKMSCGGSTYRALTAYWDVSLAGGECKSNPADSAASPRLLVAENRSVVAGNCYNGECELSLLCVRREGTLQAEHHVGAPCSRDYIGPSVSSGCSTLSTGRADGECCFL